MAANRVGGCTGSLEGYELLSCVYSMYTYSSHSSYTKEHLNVDDRWWRAKLVWDLDRSTAR